MNAGALPTCGLVRSMDSVAALLASRELMLLMANFGELGRTLELVAKRSVRGLVNFDELSVPIHPSSHEFAKVHFAFIWRWLLSSLEFAEVHPSKFIEVHQSSRKLAAVQACLDALTPFCEEGKTAPLLFCEEDDVTKFSLD